jgi:hypothetical protein
VIPRKYRLKGLPKGENQVKKFNRFYGCSAIHPTDYRRIRKYCKSVQFVRVVWKKERNLLEIPQLGSSAGGKIKEKSVKSASNSFVFEIYF